MKLLNFYASDGIHVGLVRRDGVLDLTLASGGARLQMGGLLWGGRPALDALERISWEGKAALLDEAALRLAPCVPSPGKIIGVGLNYVRYMKAQNAPLPDRPYLFPKFGESVRASGDTIVLPHNSQKVDFEAELAVVMGKRARLVSSDSALEYVAGYCCANDLTARDFQNETASWLPGKCCDGFTPVGPYLVTSDEIQNPNALHVRAVVNGEVRQDFCTSDMIRSVSELIAGISRYFTLNPGDILLTGTSVGHIMLDPEDKRKWLAPGDVVEVEIDGLGRLVNCFKEEDGPAPAANVAQPNR